MTASAWEVANWRAQVWELYRSVRAATSPEAGHERWRDERERLLREHPASPVPSAQRAAFELDIAPYDPAFRFEAPVLDAAPLRRDVQTGTDGVVPFERIGVVELAGLGRLDVWRLASYGGGIFLPMRDATSGRSTYGAGRYVLDSVKGAFLGGDKASLVVDLNFAFQPSCAYDEAWACPLPGAGNRIETAVPVGERYQATPS